MVAQFITLVPGGNKNRHGIAQCAVDQPGSPIPMQEYIAKRPRETAHLSIRHILFKKIRHFDIKIQRKKRHSGILLLRILLVLFEVKFNLK